MLEEPAPLRERYGNSWIPRPSSASPREGPRGASVNRRPGIGSRVRSVAPRSNGSAREYSGPVLADHPETALEPHRLPSFGVELGRLRGEWPKRRRRSESGGV